MSLCVRRRVKICECRSRFTVLYPRQYYNTLRNILYSFFSSCMQFSLLTKHTHFITGIYAPLFSYFPVCTRNARHPNISLVRLILFAGFVIIMSSSSFSN